MRRAVVIGALLLGCAGRSERIEPSPEASAGSTSGGELAGAAGVVAMAGAGGDPAEWPTEAVPVGEGTFPLFVNDRGGGSARAPEVDAEGTIHFVFGSDVSEVNISTHMHYVDLTALFASIAFEVRASPPTTMVVAATPISSNTLSEDQAAGFTWLGTTVRVTESFEAHDVPFDAMAPLGSGEIRPLADQSGTEIRFLLPEAAGLELGLRNVELRP